MRCGSCYRFTEDWRDARANGLEVRDNRPIKPAKKPRQGIKGVCVMLSTKGPVTTKSKACKHWRPRAVWNFGTVWRWMVSMKVSAWVRKYIRIPLGGLRKPLPLKWVPGWGHAPEPKCPHCGQMPYSTEQCLFCGQRFTQEDTREGDDE